MKKFWNILIREFLMSVITIRYSAIDGFSATKKYKKIENARKYAKERIGDHPEFGGGYAVSDDGVGKITCHGCTLQELFGE